MQKKGRARQTGCIEDHAYAENGRCRLCARVRARRYRSRRGDAVRTRDRERKTTLRAREDDVAALARARAILGVYLQRGKVERPERCTECRSGRALPYHRDVSRPLDVEWLCRGCRRLRRVLVEQDVAAPEVFEAEEDRAVAIAAANRLRQIGEVAFGELDGPTQAEAELLYATSGAPALLARFGDGDRTIGLVEFLARRANHARAREAMRRRLGVV